MSGLRKRAGKARQAAAAAPVAAAESADSLRKITGIAIGIGAVLLAGLAAFLLLRSPGKLAQPPVASATTVAPVTLAVLPFANLSSDPEQEYFSDGLTEEILNQLAQVDALIVTARTSSFSFKGRNEDVRVIAQKLGVTNLLEGSIRKEGKQLRITTQLVSGKDGAHLWSKSYDRQLSSVFALQEEIAKDVASALSIKLDVGATSRARGGTNNLDAWDKYLQAVAQLNKGFTMDSATQAVQLAREAVALDPAFARARETLVRALAGLHVWKPADAAALSAEIVQVAQGTVKLAPDSIQALRIRLDQLTRQHKWLEAEALIKSAARTPGGIGMQSGFLFLVGRLGEMVPEFQRICQQDPVSIACSGSLQSLLTASGRFADAEAEYQRSKGLDGGHIESDAVAMVRNSRMGVDPKIILAQYRSLLKDRNLPLARDTSQVDRIDSMAAASAFLRRISEDPANQEAFRMAIIAYYASAIGDTDLAMKTMRHGVVDMGGGLANLWVASSPETRTDPRFRQMLRDTGLIDFFRSSGKWNDFCEPVGKDDFQCH